MKAENAEKWIEVYESINPVKPKSKGSKTKRRPINFNRKVTNLLDDNIEEEAKPLTQTLGSAFEKVGL